MLQGMGFSDPLARGLKDATYICVVVAGMRLNSGQHPIFATCAVGKRSSIFIAECESGFCCVRSDRGVLWFAAFDRWSRV